MDIESIGKIILEALLVIAIYVYWFSVVVPAYAMAIR